MIDDVGCSRRHQCPQCGVQRVDLLSTEECDIGRALQWCHMSVMAFQTTAISTIVVEFVQGNNEEKHQVHLIRSLCDWDPVVTGEFPLQKGSK